MYSFSNILEVLSALHKTIITRRNNTEVKFSVERFQIPVLCLVIRYICTAEIYQFIGKPLQLSCLINSPVIPYLLSCSLKF